MSLVEEFTEGSEDKQKYNVNSYVKRAGPLLLGPQLCNSPVKCVTHCLARKDGTDQFYTVKILTLPDPAVGESTDDIQGKILLHTECSLLKRLNGQKGVVQHYGMYKDLAEEEVDVGGKGYSTGRMQERICLVLGCYMPHDFSPEYTSLVNLQQFVIKEKKLSESLAIKIFYNVVKVVNNLHKQNVVHRDLKLGNIVLDKDTKEVTLTNFGLGKHLSTEDEQLRDQRGSPAYISPDVISGKPYVGKPSDMWALGVVLYTMLYGQFPFYDSSPTELFRKIKLADYTIPSEHTVSQPTVKLIQSLLVLDPHARLTASKTLARLDEIIRAGEAFLVDSNLQVVPDFNLGQDYDDDYQRGRQFRRQMTFPEMSGADIEMMLSVLSNPTSNKASVKDEESVHEPPTKVSRYPSLGGLANLKVICADEPTRIVPSVDMATIRERVNAISTPSSDAAVITNATRNAVITTTTQAPPVLTTPSSYRPTITDFFHCLMLTQLTWWWSWWCFTNTKYWDALVRLKIEWVCS
ncbi:serine/threonine-protein kinase 40 isoform X2 [Folsomia candida]|uniref:serine/threonine-protein kinase 40 isoform X2 n=1 Tax=Folsomia candida TaxID=158441 RepID=UPI0016051B6E|nr:serine/threonine-protein kinase 40 isoform X2 [Folsomia candida]